MAESKIAFQRRLGDELCFAFRHFPVTPVHPHAEDAARVRWASKGAGVSGRKAVAPLNP